MFLILYFWRTSEEPNQIPLAVVVVVDLLSSHLVSHPAATPQAILGSEETSHLLQNLDPDTDYDVTVTAIYPDESESEDLLGSQRTRKLYWSIILCHCLVQSVSCWWWKRHEGGTYDPVVNNDNNAKYALLSSSAEGSEW